MEEFLNIFSSLRRENLHLLREIYTRDIVFRDPVHEINGLDNLADYFSELYANIDSIAFDFIHPLYADNCGYVQWTMSFSHPRLSQRKSISVKGVSFLKFTPEGKVYHHSDHFDLGEMIYEHLPVLGFLVKSVKRRIAS